MHCIKWCTQCTVNWITLFKWNKCFLVRLYVCLCTTWNSIENRLLFIWKWAIKSEHITSTWVIYFIQSDVKKEIVVNAIKRHLLFISIEIYDSISLNIFLTQFTPIRAVFFCSFSSFCKSLWVTHFLQLILGWIFFYLIEIGVGRRENHIYGLIDLDVCYTFCLFIYLFEKFDIECFNAEKCWVMLNQCKGENYSFQMNTSLATLWIGRISIFNVLVRENAQQHKKKMKISLKIEEGKKATTKTFWVNK